jgi:hypothetical protein
LRPRLASAILVLAMSAWLSLPATARTRQNPADEPQAPATEQSASSDPAGLVRSVIATELKDDAQTQLFSWMERKKRPRDGTQVERDVQTPSGVISRVLMIDDKPLDAGQQKAEEARLRKATEPAQMRRKQKEDQEGDARAQQMVGAIPDAFDFVNLGSTTGANGHKLTRLKFSPRAGFNPPSRETVVFTAMEGELLVDETASRLVKVDGRLFRDVNFGWGIFGRLYKGGQFLVEKSEVTPTHWDTTRSRLHFDGKVLLFKSLHIDEDETSWDYQPVQPMTVEQALDFLSRPETHPEAAQDAMTNGSSPGGRSAVRSNPAARHSLARAHR